MSRIAAYFALMFAALMLAYAVVKLTPTISRATARKTVDRIRGNLLLVREQTCKIEKGTGVVCRWVTK